MAPWKMDELDDVWRKVYAAKPAIVSVWPSDNDDEQIIVHASNAADAERLARKVAAAPELLAACKAIAEAENPTTRAAVLAAISKAESR